MPEGAALFTSLVAIVTSVGGAIVGYRLYHSQAYKAKAEGALTYAEIAEKATDRLDKAHERINQLERELALQVRRWILALPLLEEYAAGNPIKEALIAEIRLLNGLHSIDKGG